ncbi:hypothetical protein QBC47DRAFT_59369 [Echria macrotheca]|uniref:Fibroin-3 related protein n=1 Tax=Echria macrotheca TaxID=438768 RepID=A0AAJ0B6M3_9PEZI|nr:hypothetical protein QBC47DRAFT_59369 [Echria macrotheca]
MPAVEVAMRRSLREGFAELLVASLRPALGRRQDIVSQANDVKTAFSSWDNCMAATYCKWPVIAIMIIGGLIIFSVVWCIIRCACCGLSCCCECCQCLKCCGNCCGCCDPPRGKRSKYLDEPYIPPNQGYKMQPPMNPHFPPVAPAMTPALTGVSTGVTAAAVAGGPPQYAEFDVSKKGGEDALPAMPSWEDAGKKKVLVEEEAVEMDQLKKPEASGQASAPNGALAAGAIAAVPNSRSPVGSPGLNRSPYGPPAGAPGSNGYFPAPGVETDPYGQNALGYPQAAGGAYGQSSTPGQDQGYGMAGAAMAAGRRSPYDNNGALGDAGYGQGRGYGAPVRQDSFGGYGAGGQGGAGYNNYGAGQGNQAYGVGARRSPPNELAGDNGYGQSNVGYHQNTGYGQEPARHSPAPQIGYGQNTGYGQEPARRSPGPQAAYGGYDNDGYDSRQYSTESTRPLRPPPQRQYSRDPQPAPAQSNTGFDFGSSAYSRPTGNYRQPSPGQEQQQGAAYPGYKAYQPSGGQQGGGGSGW